MFWGGGSMYIPKTQTPKESKNPITDIKSRNYAVYFVNSY